jgi:sec-independent protein translocase protein TatA
MRPGLTEILIILGIALLLFGAGRLADIGKGLGEGIRNFKKGIKEGDGDEDEEASAEDEDEDDKEADKLPAPAPKKKGKKKKKGFQESPLEKSEEV